MLNFQISIKRVAISIVVLSAIALISFKSSAVASKVYRELLPINSFHMQSESHIGKIEVIGKEDKTGITFLKISAFKKTILLNKSQLDQLVGQSGNGLSATYFVPAQKLLDSGFKTKGSYLILSFSRKKGFSNIEAKNLGFTYDGQVWINDKENNL